MGEGGRELTRGVDVCLKFTSVPASPSRENTCAFSKVEVVVTSFTCE